MRAKVETKFRQDHRYGPGFYNRLTFQEKHLEGSIEYGPYPSRPLAKIAAVKQKRAA